MPGGSRSLPGRPSLRFLKLEAKRRLAAGEFPSLHDAQAAIAWEHGVPSWTVLKQQVCAPESRALAHVRWLVSRFQGADDPGWTAPGDEELRRHFHDRFLAVLPPARLAELLAKTAPDLRQELVVMNQTAHEVQFQLAGLRYIAIADSSPPYRLVGLQGYPIAERIADTRVTTPPPARTHGDPPEEIAAIAAGAFAELGLPALILAGSTPGAVPASKTWLLAQGHADLDRAELVDTGHRWPAPGISALVTATAVLRLVAQGRIALDAPARDYLRAVRLEDGDVTVRDLLTHTSGLAEPRQLFGDSVLDLAAVTGQVIGSSGPRGECRPGNAGFAVLGQLIADVTGTPFAPAVTRLVLDPLGMRDSRFPARSQDIGPGAVSGYAVTATGDFVPVPTRICTIQALGGLWSTPADLIRLGTGWASLIPAPLARQAVTRQTGPGPNSVGLGWLLARDGETAVFAGVAADSAAVVHIRVSDGRTHLVLTSRPITLESVDGRLLRSWTNPQHENN